MNIEGRPQLSLQLADGAAAVGTASRRTLQAASVLHGKPRAVALKMLPLPFSVCATAQSSGSVRALEQAHALAVEAPTGRIRQALVDMEAVRENLWRILLDWPLEVAAEPGCNAMAEFASIQRELTHALCLAGNALAFGWLDGHGDAEALATLRGAAEQIEQRAGLLIAAIDPCVSYDLCMKEAA